MGKLVAQTGKPIVLHSLYNFARPHSLDLLRYYNIPVFDSVEVACKSVAVLSQYGQYLRTHQELATFVFSWGARAKNQGKEIIAAALAENRRSLLEPEAKQLLRLHGVPVPDEGLARDPDEAVELARSMRPGSVALKICSPDILHKSDAGGVLLNLDDEASIRAGFVQIVDRAQRYRPTADIRGCVVSPMVASGTEVIIGTKLDPQFGPVIMFGVGGVLVEVLKDVVFRVLPISRRAARRMISEIRSAPLLNGFRGEPAVNREALIDLLVAVSEVVEAYPEIREMDLNPIIVDEHGACAVDARVLLGNGR